MAASQDTEITLGTGKMLLLFFGLVAICAVFFGVGFSLGKNSSRSMVSTDNSMTSAPVAPIARPSGGKPTGSASSSSVADEYKPVDAKGSDAGVRTTTKDANEGEAKQTSGDSAAPANTAAITSASGYFVQVAAVTKADDADALVAALKKKQYVAFVAPTSSSDKFYRVQVGPFSDVKEAETTRAKLVSDGYNPIIKK